MSNIAQLTLTRLRDDFILRLPGRIALLKSLLDGVTRGESGAVEALHREAHSLAGVAGTHRLMQIFEAARKLELIVAAVPPGREATDTELTDMRVALADIVIKTQQPNYSGSSPPVRQQDSQRIVVVDDDVEQADWLRSVLEQDGYQVEVFNELNAFRDNCKKQGMPDAVIMDMIFPEGDDAGARVIAEMKEQCLGAVPVIFLSVRDDIAAKLAAYRAGATRYLTKPVEPDKLLQAVNESAALMPTEPYRVLLVDDDSDQLAIHALLLRQGGMEVRTSSDPLQVPQILVDFAAEILLLDMYMPQCSGTELAVILRDDARYVGIPVIYLSAETDISKQLLALDRVGDLFLTKPVEPGHLIAVVGIHARRFRQSLEQSEALRSTLYERERQQQALDAHVIVSASDVAGNITYVNDKFCEASGYSREELLGKNHRIVKSGFHPHEFYADMWHSIKNGHIWQGEICNKRKDGSLHWMESSIVPFMGSDDRPYQYIAIRTDITQFKQHAETLLENEAQLRMVLDNAADAVFVAGKDERWIYVNDRAVSMLGYSRGELLGMSIYDFVPEDWRETYRQNFHSKLLADGVMHQEIRLIKKDGSKVAIGMNAAVLPDGTVYGSCRDISARKQAEAALRESEGRFRNMADSAPALIWLADTQNLGTWYNKLWLKYTGRSMEQELGLGWAAGVHPDDLQRCVAYCSEAFNARRTFEMEFRLRRADGSYGWIADTGIPRFNDQGEFEGYIGYCWDITERKQAEAARQEMLDRLQKIASRVPGMVYQFRMRPDGSFCFPYVSEGIREIIRVNPEDVREDASKAFAAVHPDDFGSLITSIQASVRDMSPWRHEFRVKLDDGTLRWLNGDALTEREADGSVLWHGFISDITERKQAESELWLTKFTFDRIKNAIEWINPEGMVLYANDYACQSLGLIREEMIGKYVWEFDPDYSPGKWAGSWEMVKKAGVQSFETRHRRKDGTIFPVEVTANFLNHNGSEYIFAFVHDITERKKIESILHSAKEAAESASRAKSEFLASMSHELRTPLNAILGFSQLFAMDTRLPLETRSNAQEIERAGQHLLSLVNDMIDLARIESGKLELSLEPVSVKTVIKDSLSMAASLAQKQNITVLETDCNEDEITVQADYVRLRQVMINLLSNAIKYNKTQGTVQVFCRINDGKARISVADTGTGIPADKQSRIFNSFDRLGEERGKIEGTGIGLVITKRLIEAMGGNIGFESVEGQGSTFWVEFRLIVSINAAASEQIAVSNASRGTTVMTGTQIDRPVVLYIEDNPMNMRLMQQIFARKNNLALCEAHSAESGIESAFTNPPALILMDINLPGINGYQALAILKADARTAHIPVIAVSANAMMGDRERGLKAGFVDYLSKPLDVKQFYTVIGRLLWPGQSGIE